MRIPRFTGVFVLALALWAPSASAFLDPPYITPASPMAGDVISVNVYGGECDIADGGVVWLAPVSEHGNEFTVLLTGGHEEDPEFCYFGVGTFTSPIGVYPPGTYTLRVDWRYDTFNGWVTQTLGTIPFTVAYAPQQQPSEAPALSLQGLVGLVLILVAISLCTLRRRTRPH
jgi:hypothetical protein